ncbi:MAG TPA: cysteine hydrolase [Noviherbaspirillum sp.]|nr:cysteine hydrolase [Noviherbaspirillum sp.]
MTRNAVLLMDLQHDFLGAEGSCMPVEPDSIAPVIDTANAILQKEILKDALPVLVVNQFPESDRIGNFFRRGAAVAGTRGAGLDSRVRCDASVKVIAKASASAFTNPELDRYLRAENITDLYVMGVFAEGCVRGTVLDARRHGYAVHVLADAVASNASWKKRFGLWAMKRAGADILPSLPVPR